MFHTLPVPPRQVRTCVPYAVALTSTDVAAGTVSGFTSAMPVIAAAMVKPTRVRVTACVYRQEGGTSVGG